MQLIRLKKLNLEVLLKLVILLGFAFFFYNIIKSGKILLYINPKIIPYVKFSIISMIILSLFILQDIFKPKRKINIKPYLVFIIPLFMAFTIPTTAVESKSMSLANVKNTKEIANPNQNDYSDIDLTNGDKTAEYIAETTKTNPNKVDVDLELQDNTIVISDNNFIQWTQEITYNMEEYEGKKIELTGFVFKDKSFKENEFVPARFMMSCCAADMQPVGLLAHYDKAKDLKQDAWMIVKGKLEIVESNGEKTPIIVVESIQDAKKPINEYVYPY